MDWKTKLFGASVTFKCVHRRRDAEDVMRRLRETSRTAASADPRVWAQLAAAYAALGNKDSAFALMERARRAGFRFSPPSPWWDPLRSDPRFQQFLKKLGGEQ